MAVRRAAKTRKPATFCEKKLQRLEFSNGGQTAPSEPAPRVGGTGDVLAGFSPRTPMIFRQKSEIGFYVIRLRNQPFCQRNELT